MSPPLLGENHQVQMALWLSLQRGPAVGCEEPEGLEDVTNTKANDITFPRWPLAAQA